MERKVAIIGFLCGVASLLYVFATRLPTPVRAASEHSGLNAATPVSAIATVSSNVATIFVSRLALEQRLRDDLRLNAEQVAEIARILASCEQSVQAAQQHPDALWRDRLVKRAHRDAYDLVIPMLTQEQREDFAVWLEAPANKEMAGWFQRGAGCKGCGGASNRTVASGGSGGPALPGASNVR